MSKTKRVGTSVALVGAGILIGVYLSNQNGVAKSDVTVGNRGWLP